MKRYRDCIIHCNNNEDTVQLLNNIETCTKQAGYKLERYTSFTPNDTMSIRSKDNDKPLSRIVFCSSSEEPKASVVNIVPLPESGVSHIDESTYNAILDSFRKDVLDVLHRIYGNAIVSNEEDYTLQDTIPQSFPKLQTWLHGYPLSSHPNDTNRFYDFVIALHTNHEPISLDDFGEYLREEYKWTEDDAYNAKLKLESFLDLIEYYDRYGHN